VRSLAVSPCDVPLAPDFLFARLLAAAGEGAALADTEDGQQPLCSVWPVGALPVLEQALAGGAHPPIWLTLARLGAIPVRFRESLAFTNVNTREDLAMLAARLEREGVPRYSGDVTDAPP
jgi:molybdopterin-guanine dinucleotide biosynthesis protein A